MIYIDDLDRCNPAKIILLLESLKLFLDIPNTIIFIAVDRYIIQKGIEAFYKQFDLQAEDYQTVALDYLDKIIQLPFYLHPLDEDQIGAYVASLINENFVQQKEIFSNCLLPNPRKIKRILNVFALNVAIVNYETNLNSRIDYSILAKFIILHEQWPNLYNDIVSYPELIGVMDNVFNGVYDKDRPQEWPTSNEIKALVKKQHHSPQYLERLFRISNSKFQGVDIRLYLSLLRHISE